jgi:predicted DNA-binding transcriptional regulator AlpA
MSEQLMTTAQAAAFLGLKQNTLEHWRTYGKGPAIVRLSPRTVRYRRSDLAAWVESRVVDNEKPLA